MLSSESSEKKEKTITSLAELFALTQDVVKNIRHREVKTLLDEKFKSLMKQCDRAADLRVLVDKLKTLQIILKDNFKDLQEKYAQEYKEIESKLHELEKKFTVYDKEEKKQLTKSATFAKEKRSVSILPRSKTLFSTSIQTPLLDEEKISQYSQFALSESKEDLEEQKNELHSKLKTLLSSKQFAQELNQQLDELPTSKREEISNEEPTLQEDPVGRIKSFFGIKTIKTEIAGDVSAKEIIATFAEWEKNFKAWLTKILENKDTVIQFSPILNALLKTLASSQDEIKILLDKFNEEFKNFEAQDSPVSGEKISRQVIFEFLKEFNNDVTKVKELFVNTTENIEKTLAANSPESVPPRPSIR